MKKTKFLSLILAFLMLMSVIILPVSAIGTVTSTTTQTYLSLSELDSISNGTRVSAYGTPTVDGTKDSNIYNEAGHVTSNYTTHDNGAKFDAYYANDAQSLYVFVEVKFGKGKTSFTDDKDLIRLYVDFYNRHTEITNDSSSAYTSNYPKNTSPYYGGQFQITAGGTKSATVNSKFQNVVVTKQYSDQAKTVASGWTAEFKIKLSDTIIEDALKNGERPVISVGYEVRRYLSNSNKNLFFFDEDIYSSDNLGYIKSASSNLWADYTMCPDVILSASANDSNDGKIVESYKASEINNNTVVIDGYADAAEGWSTMPYTTLDSILGSTAGGYKFSRDIPEVRYSVDNDYIYALYNSSIVTGTGGEYDRDKDVTFGFDFGNDYATVKVLNPTNTDTYAVQVNGFTADKVDIAKNTDGTCIEMRVAIPESVKSARMTEDVKMSVNVLTEREATNYAAKLCPSEGYTVGEGTVSLTLPSYNQTRFAGVQKTAVDATGKYNARFSAVMGDYTAYDEAGFDFTYVSLNGNEVNKTADAECTYVYSSILAADSEVAPTVYGGQYFYCFSIKGLTQEDIYVFNVKPYVVAKNSTDKIYGSELTVTVSAGTVYCGETELGNYNIVIPQNASAQETLIANNLHYNLELNYGYAMDIVSEGSNSTNDIFVVTDADMDAGAYAISVDVDGDITISAADLRGFEALHEYLATTALYTHMNGKNTVVEYSGTAKNSLIDGTSLVGTKTGDIRVMSYNVYGWASYGPENIRQELQMDMISAYVPDVIGFQEYGDIENANYDENMTSILTDGGYTKVDVTISGTNNTPIFYNDDKLDLIDKGWYLFNYTGNDGSKSLTWAVFKAEDQTEFLVISTHLINRSENASERVNSINELLGLFNTDGALNAYSTLPVVLVGDFNSYSNEDCHSTLTSNGFSHAFSVASSKNNTRGWHENSIWNDTYGVWSKIPEINGAANYAIDHSYVKNINTVNTYAAITSITAMWTSDHMPVIIDVSF